jgi:peptidoglycan/LPS O-acetylase OafA/YrhL
MGAGVLLTLIPLPNSGGWVMDMYRGIYVTALLIAVTLEGGRYRGPLSAAGDWLVEITKHRFFAFLADMSYGVYLLHALIVPIVVGWLATQGMDRIPRTLAALAICIPLSYALAWIFHIYIEVPGISLGRYLLQRPVKASIAPAAQ